MGCPYLQSVCMKHCQLVTAANLIYLASRTNVKWLSSAFSKLLQYSSTFCLPYSDHRGWHFFYLIEPWQYPPRLSDQLSYGALVAPSEYWRISIMRPLACNFFSTATSKWYRGKGEQRVLFGHADKIASGRDRLSWHIGKSHLSKN